MSFDAVGLRVPAAKAASAAQLLLGCGAAGTWEADPPGQRRTHRQPWDAHGPPPVEEVEVRAFFTSGQRELLGQRLEEWALAHQGRVRWWIEEEQDWEAESRDSFPRLEWGEDLAIAAPWNAQPGDVVIEPGQGYGTGHHACTHMAIAALLDLRLPDEAVLDVGCGAGVLSLVATRLGHPALGFDADPLAVQAARANADRSGLTTSFSTSQLADWRQGAPLVLANLYAEMLVDHAATLSELASRMLVTSGILLEKEASVVRAFMPRLHAAQRWTLDGWVCLAWSVA